MEGFLIAIVIIFYFLSGFNHRKIIEKLKSELEDKNKKIDNLLIKGAFDSILDVKKFNDWFNSKKDPSIYANPGIFLRLDKLSQGHIRSFIESESEGLLDYDYFDSRKLYKFEDKIRKNWIKQINET